jgi:hypothetical protein
MSDTTYGGGKIIGITNHPPPGRKPPTPTPDGWTKAGTRVLKDIHTHCWRVAQDGEYTYPTGDMELTEDFDLRNIKPDAEVPLRPVFNDRVRGYIKEAFLKLDDLLGHECQTTHGRFPCRSLGELLEELIVMYHNPGPYTVSNLSQAIQSYFKERQ